MREDPRRYIQVTNGLRDDIETGVHKPGRRLPPIQQLCRKYGCSRRTVGHAMRILEETEGLVQRIPGLGYYVTDD